MELKEALKQLESNVKNLQSFQTGQDWEAFLTIFSTAQAVMDAKGMPERKEDKNPHKVCNPFCHNSGYNTALDEVRPIITRLEQTIGHREQEAKLMVEDLAKKDMEIKGLKVDLAESDEELEARFKFIEKLELRVKELEEHMPKQK
jgi:hypothetical protein